MNDLSPRDQSILTLFSRFKQLTSPQLHELVFNGLTRTPVERALRRLVERDYLIRVERRIVGGSRGGSGQYVYALGRRGWWLGDDPPPRPYRAARTVSYHSLAIVELYLQLRRYEQAGLLSIVGLSTEPDSWAMIQGTELKPDMFTQLTIAGRTVKIWWEVDMATESQKQVRGKLEAAVRAYTGANSQEWPEFPVTVWVAVDAEREKELRWLVSQMPAETQGLFRVCQRETVAGVLNLA